MRQTSARLDHGSRIMAVTSRSRLGVAAGCSCPFAGIKRRSWSAMANSSLARGRTALWSEQWYAVSRACVAPVLCPGKSFSFNLVPIALGRCHDY